jgi:PadR family transcriptional regulator AphA
MSIPLPDETILGLLSVEPQHGYQLLARFESKSELGRIWTLSRSQLYAVLKRLEQDKLIKGKTVQSKEAPARRVYTITPAGEQRLEDWLIAAPLSSSMRQIRVQFISRLYVAQQMNLPIQPLVERQRAVCLKQRDQLLAAQATSSSETELLVIDFVLGQLDAVLDWLTRTEKSLLANSI